MTEPSVFDDRVRRLKEAEARYTQALNKCPIDGAPIGLIFEVVSCEESGSGVLHVHPVIPPFDNEGKPSILGVMGGNNFNTIIPAYTRKDTSPGGNMLVRYEGDIPVGSELYKSPTSFRRIINDINDAMNVGEFVSFCFTPFGGDTVTVDSWTNMLQTEYMRDVAAGYKWPVPLSGLYDMLADGLVTAGGLTMDAAS